MAHSEPRAAAFQEQLEDESQVAQEIQTDIKKLDTSKVKATYDNKELRIQLKPIQMNFSTKKMCGDENLIKRLSEQLDDSHKEIRFLNNQLKSTQHRSQQYCDVVDSSETQLRELTAQYNKTKEDLEIISKESRVEIVTLTTKIEELEEELARISNDRLEWTHTEFNELLSTAEKELGKLYEINEKLEFVNDNNQNVSNGNEESKNENVKRMILSFPDLQLLAKLTEAKNLILEKMTTLFQQRDSALEAFESQKSLSEEKQKQWCDEIERTNKVCTEDRLKLQGEFDSLKQLLTSEREVHAKQHKELDELKNDKLQFEELVSQLQQQLQQHSDRATQLSEEVDKLREDLLVAVMESDVLKKKLAENECLLAEKKNKEVQLRTIGKKYKTLYDEKMKNEEFKISEMRKENNELREKIDRLTRENEESKISELREVNKELKENLESLTRESSSLREKMETAIRESANKEMRAKTVLKGARSKIMQLMESSEAYEKQISELKMRIELNANDSDTSSEYMRLAALKSQMERQVARLQQEKTTMILEKEAVVQRIVEVQRQLANITGEYNDVADIKPVLTQSGNIALHISQSQLKDSVESTQREEQKGMDQLQSKLSSSSKFLIGQKRPRDLDGVVTESLNTEIIDNHREQEHALSPCTKKIKCQEIPAILENISLLPSRSLENQEIEINRLNAKNAELALKVDELNLKLSEMKNESENRNKEIEINKSRIEPVSLRKIRQMTKTYEKKIDELTGRTALGSDDSHNSITFDYHTLQSQMDELFERLSKETEELHKEYEILLQTITKLRFKLASISDVSQLESAKSVEIDESTAIEREQERLNVKNSLTESSNISQLQIVSESRKNETLNRIMQKQVVEDNDKHETTTQIENSLKVKYQVSTVRQPEDEKTSETIMTNISNLTANDGNDKENV